MQLILCPNNGCLGPAGKAGPFFYLWRLRPTDTPVEAFVLNQKASTDDRTAGTGWET
ncbi:MAG: hypothetical protein K6B40_04295 [Firmicutes bacterium]|nr:hypothetical protein [Bacillota bacterium]